MFLRSAFVTASLSLCCVTPAYGQAGADLASKIVNDPSNPSVNGAQAALQDDPKAPGGKALRLRIPKKGQNPWDSAIESVIAKPIKAGDQIALFFSIRLEKGEGGATTTTIPYAAVQLASAPYSTVFQQSAEIGPEWKDVEIRGVADKDYPPGSLKAVINLATAKQTIDFGPLIVFDLGPKK